MGLFTLQAQLKELKEANKSPSKKAWNSNRHCTWEKKAKKEKGGKTNTHGPTPKRIAGWLYTL